MGSTSAWPVELSIVIVSYNTRDVTLASLDSLYRFPPGVPFEVILLDNASSDGSIDAVRERFPQVIAIAHDENSGFAGGNNLAIERARGRRVLLLNPDTIVLESTFHELWAFAEREPQRGIWGGRTFFEDMSLNPTSCWRRITPWSLFCSASGMTAAFPRSVVFNPEAFGAWPRDSEREVDIVSGCFLLIDHDLWTRLGGFDPTFFMYGEEADLCLRARAFGARPAVTHRSELIHLGGRSEVSQTEKVIKVTRGRATLVRRHWSPLAAKLGRAMLLGWSLLRLIGSRLLSGPNDDPASSRAKWAEIWRRRAEWVNGYPERSRSS